MVGSPITVHLLSLTGLSAERSEPLNPDVRQTPGIGEDLGSLGWGTGMRGMKGRVGWPLLPNPIVPPVRKEQR